MLQNCQATGTGTGNGTGNRESRIETVPVLTVKSHRPPPPTTHPQLLKVKVSSGNKVPLVRMSQDDPLNPSSTRNYQVDSENNNQGESNMIKEKIIKNP